jgi:Na+-transporting methylmalonyl-CoA/oxaloacetate decarboxylase gamma subunit
MEEITKQYLQMKMTFVFIMVSLLIAAIDAIAALHRVAWPKTLQALIHTELMVPREEDHCGDRRIKTSSAINSNLS